MQGHLGLFSHLLPLYSDHRASLDTSKLRAFDICSQYWKVNLKGLLIASALLHSVSF